MAPHTLPNVKFCNQHRPTGNGLVQCRHTFGLLDCLVRLDTSFESNQCRQRRTECRQSISEMNDYLLFGTNQSRHFVLKIRFYGKRNTGRARLIRRH